MSSLEIQREINAPVARVFSAWSDPVQMGKWFYPGDMSCDVNIDFREGGAFEVLMTNPEKDLSLSHTGVYKEIEENHKIVFTWNSPFVQDTLVALTFEPAGSATMLTLKHTLFEDEAMREQHNGGWQSILDKFAQHVSAVATV